MKTKIKQNNKIIEIDYLRALAILGVIIIHATAYFTEMNAGENKQFIPIFFNNLFVYAAPLFFLVSGFVLANKYKVNYSIAQFYQKRLKAVLPPYLFFSIIFTFLKDAPNLLDGKSVLTPKVIFLNLFFGDAFYHLWFIACLIQLYLIYPILIKLARRFPKLLLLGSLLATLGYQAICISYTKVASDSWFTFSTGRALFLNGIFYFALGIVLSLNYAVYKKALGKISSEIIFLLAIFVLSINLLVTVESWLNIKFGFYYYEIPLTAQINKFLLNPLLIFSEIFLLFIFVLKSREFKKSSLNKLLAFGGAFSFGIYLIHPIFDKLFLYGLRAINITPNSLIFYPIIASGILSGSAFVLLIANKIPYVRAVFGLRNGQNHGKA